MLVRTSAPCCGTLWELLVACRRKLGLDLICCCFCCLVWFCLVSKINITCTWETVLLPSAATAIDSVHDYSKLIILYIPPWKLTWIHKRTVLEHCFPIGVVRLWISCECGLMVLPSFRAIAQESRANMESRMNQGRPPSCSWICWCLTPVWNIFLKNPLFLEDPGSSGHGDCPLTPDFYGSYRYR